ncbi:MULTISPECIES: mechanosensitive ion channel family protein [Aliivibrio]|uniref:Small-conductance mechanosensitive channel n=1 Tax=Aliivibrio finisterrensis TaxID=511998 RepID=A0A4Q5KTT7_9GAMM|nr:MULTISPECIES: mechanosensitive ion channel family protein [Aliivibrio]MDD9177683.1 mechanosensitive ion channel family protein [Aliivibrio sp. A6]RYU51294.1 mechanosensitive ion channel [Aliivibrio finisterrensis]RYU54491.1 mechanosensitive ion channel [Aliivibrio finisterrensis]RYU59559.1 mechanosensitive ion channel [Aliivibrio finisterrensis]RYU65426.1 mechanosensitive ion channel [Aliivibrio finisterrensis]
MRYLIGLFLLFSTITFANEAQDLADLDKINNEVARLKQEAASFKGSDLAVIRVQQLGKNNQLRAVLADLIKRHDETTTPLLVTEVKNQVAYANRSIAYLDKSIKEKQEKLDKASIEQKLALQNTLKESKDYYYLTLNDQLENYQWLDRLGSPEEKNLVEFTLFIDQKIKFLSASLSFDNSREQLLSDQLQHSSDSEKSSLTLDHLFFERKVTNSTYGLTKLISIADQLNINTTDYKRQVFSTTGNLTEDILNFPVIAAILSNWISSGSNWLLKHAPDQLLKFLVFVLILFATRMVAQLTRRVVLKAVVQPHLRMSKLMQDFFVSMSSKLIYFIGILIAFSKIGLDLAPVLTGFGVAGIIIGFALQDTLSNFASGMMLLIYRPFDVGDFVEAGGVSGKVSSMSLVNTTIKTFDNQIIILPNSKIWGDVIKNVTHERLRRVDMVFGIGYDDSIEHAEKILAEIVDAHPAALKKPEPNIRVHTLGASSVDFIVRPWVKTDDYWDVYWDITREVKLRFDKEGISIPFAQQDIHVHFAKKDKKPNEENTIAEEIGSVIDPARSKES